MLALVLDSSKFGMEDTPKSRGGICPELALKMHPEDARNRKRSLSRHGEKGKFVLFLPFIKYPRSYYIRFSWTKKIQATGKETAMKKAAGKSNQAESFKPSKSVKRRGKKSSTRSSQRAKNTRREE
nr:hypothetical protein Iba_chr09aCG15440 [Ipomoea batatas]